MYYEANYLDDSPEVCDNDLTSSKVEVEKVPDLDDLQSSVTLLIQQQTSKSLMTPEDFTPGGMSRASSVRNSLEPKQGENEFI